MASKRAKAPAKTAKKSAKAKVAPATAPTGHTFQQRIEAIFFERDNARGVQGTLLWFVEEVGELVRAIRRGERQNLEEEFADVYAWLATLASLHGLDLEAMGQKKYAGGCPRCRAVPCACPHPKPVV